VSYIVHLSCLYRTGTVRNKAPRRCSCRHDAFSRTAGPSTESVDARSYFIFMTTGPRRPGIQMIEQGRPCPQVAQQFKQRDWRKNILELSQQRRSRECHDHISRCVNRSLKAAGPTGRSELWSSSRSRERQSTATWCSHPLDSPAPDHRVIARTVALRIHMSATGF
jgi:hypothetical protein